MAKLVKLCNSRRIGTKIEIRDCGGVTTQKLYLYERIILIPMSDLEQRLAALEDALALPHEGNRSLAAHDLSKQVNALEKELIKSQYRAQHLVRAYDAQVTEIAQLRAEIASLKQSKQ